MYRITYCSLHWSEKLKSCWVSNLKFVFSELWDHSGLVVSGCAGINYSCKSNGVWRGWWEMFETMHSGKVIGRGVSIWSPVSLFSIIWPPLYYPSFFFVCELSQMKQTDGILGDSLKWMGKKSGQYFSRRWKRWETKVGHIASLLDIISVASVSLKLNFLLISSAVRLCWLLSL